MSTVAASDPTFDLIQGVISKATKLPPEVIRLENPVTGLANVDSIVLLEIVARVEVTLGIDIDEELLFNIQTVGDFVEVCKRLGSGTAAAAAGGAS